ncbi:hypothetical protein BC940DRAFT_307738 [Gongronella butleri]|nr:hypothetical protein BC940DRAFT_307738 [Gongronella butleri]
MTTRTRLTIDQQHIHAKFEGYKLAPFDEASCLVRADLPSGGLQVRRQGQMHHSRLGFRQLQARVRFNHLAVAPPLDSTHGTGFFVDEQYAVIAATFDKASRTITYDAVVELTRPMDAVPNFTRPSDDVPLEPEYPSVVSIGKDLLVAANGVGHIELVGLELQDGRWAGTILDTYSYNGTGKEGIEPVPCTLLAARRVHTKIVLVVCSQEPTKATRFNIATLELSLPEALNHTATLTIRHIQQGTEVPVYCDLTADGQCTILGSEGPFVTLKDDGSEVEKEEETVHPHKATYQWTQEGEDVTVQYQLPPGTPISAISCQFTNEHLVLLVRAEGVDLSFPYRKWWTNIKADQSTWTLETKSGVLTLFLVKHDVHTRWPHVFDKDDGVLETLSAEQLANISQSLDKFTSDVATTASTTGQLTTYPAATDMDEDIDEFGQPIHFDIIDIHGKRTHVITSGQEWLGRAFDLQRLGASNVLPSVVCKMDVDGLVYTWRDQNLAHTASLHAFGYIQASKRDRRFVFHDPGLQFAVIVESSRNAYVYHHHDDKRLHETQTLIDVTQGNDTDILGVQLINERVLMILTESHIVVALL